MAVGWDGVVLAVLVFWFLQGFACAPLLAVESIRSTLAWGPAATPERNYLLTVTVVVAGHVAVFLAGVGWTGGFEGRNALRYTFGMAAGYPLALAAGAYLLSIRRDRSIPPWAIAIAAVWYALVASLAVIAVFLGLFALYFPG